MTKKKVAKKKATEKKTAKKKVVMKKVAKKKTTRKKATTRKIAKKAIKKITKKKVSRAIAGSTGFFDTAEALEFIARHKASGDLIDIYSDDFKDIWIDHVKKLSEADIEELKGHLLMLRLEQVDPADPEIIEELREDLVGLFPPLNEVLNAKNSIGLSNHNPDILFIDLNAQGVYCIGLGRKNRLFSFTLPADTHPDVKIGGRDHAGVIETISDAIEAIGDADYAYYSEVFEYELMHQSGPNEDGVYESEHIDGTYTEAELQEVISAQQELEDKADLARDTLQKFFPIAASSHSDWQFHTGDY